MDNHLRRNFIYWISLIFLLPFLYLSGWFFTQLIIFIGLNFPQDVQSLISSIFSFILFLFVVPTWVKIRWQSSNPWMDLGLDRSSGKLIFVFFFKGLLWGFLLLTAIVLPLLFIDPSALTLRISQGGVLNACFLIIGVGFAEELIFRGWLLSELSQRIGSRLGMIVQAGVFSLVHIRTESSIFSMIFLLVGLFLLGLILSLIRKLDNGSIWCCIGLHGGLVGGWFFLNDGVITISPEAPSWLIGFGGESANPISSLLAIMIFLAIIFFQIIALAKAPRP